MFMMPDFGGEVGDAGLTDYPRGRFCYKFLSAHQPEQDILRAIPESESFVK